MIVQRRRSLYPGKVEARDLAGPRPKAQLAVSFSDSLAAHADPFRVGLLAWALLEGDASTRPTASWRVQGHG
jgi:hypothetical protein